MIDTRDPIYWLNWRFLLCGIYLLCTIAFASFLVWKYEGGAKKPDNERRQHQQQVSVGVLFEDEVWKTCLKGLHPVWLMLFRILAFVVLLGIITGNAIFHGFGVFFYYTQWTFTLTTIYFGVASVFSIYGYCQHLDHEGTCGIKDAPENGDAEQGSRVASTPGSRENTSLLKSLCNNEHVNFRQIAGPMGYALQIVYQVTAGAVMLTDVVFWLVIYPFLTAKDFRLAFEFHRLAGAFYDSLLAWLLREKFDVSMHSVNILVLGDTMLNCMRFPMFRLAYFILWTAVFVIFQWIFHMFVSLRWPYPFMDLSTPYAPIWYLLVGLLHIPCYGTFALIVKLKHLWLSRSYPESYQCSR